MPKTVFESTSLEYKTVIVGNMSFWAFCFRYSISFVFGYCIVAAWCVSIVLWHFHYYWKREGERKKANAFLVMIFCLDGPSFVLLCAEIQVKWNIKSKHFILLQAPYFSFCSSSVWRYFIFELQFWRVVHEILYCEAFTFCAQSE